MAHGRPPGDVLVRPVAEHLADGELADVYRDLKATLGVPWVGVITQALAYYRSFFLEAWQQFRPIAASHFFERATDELRLLAWEGVSASFAIPSHAGPLAAAGYSDREFAEIRATLDLFVNGNPKYLILATAVAESLTSNRMLGSATDVPRSPLPRVAVSVIGSIPTMIEEHHATADIRKLYRDVKRTLDLPFVNSDYKAMARWPTYFAHSWHSLKPVIGQPAYVRLRESIANRAQEIVEALPYPYRMDRKAAAQSGMDDVAIDELCRSISLFRWLIPGLILNVSFFRLALTNR